LKLKRAARGREPENPVAAMDTSAHHIRMSTPLYRQARRHLSRNCPVMKQLIARVGPCTLVPTPDEPFTLLVRCVVSQQISTKAAESIFGKLAVLVDGPPLAMSRVARLTDAKLRACGLSAPKQRTLRAVIDHVTANPDLLPGIATRDDATIREQLTAIKGIGPWSADMFLMFGLGRPDVLPVGDLGFKMAIKNLYRLRKFPDAKKLEKRGEPWRPYRSIATWYLWRSLDPKYRE
jgi:DNA-3-methyladenine glycosylase II